MPQETLFDFLFSIENDRRNKNKKFVVRFIRKVIKTKEYKGRNGKIYKDTIYELLGIQIVNPRIYIDKKHDEHYIVWYPKHEEIEKMLRFIGLLRDGYTVTFWLEVIKIAMISLLFNNMTKERLQKFINDIINDVYDLNEKEGDN